MGSSGQPGGMTEWERRKAALRERAPALFERVAIILGHGDVLAGEECELAAETLFEDVRPVRGTIDEIDLGRVLGAIAKLALGTYEEGLALTHAGLVSGLDRVFGAVVYALGMRFGSADNLILFHDGLRRIHRPLGRLVLDEVVGDDPGEYAPRWARGLVEAEGSEGAGDESSLRVEEQGMLSRIWPAIRSALGPGKGDREAVGELAKERPKYAVATLVLAAQSHDPDVRAAALRALGMIDPDSARVLAPVAPTFASRLFA